MEQWPKLATVIRRHKRYLVWVFAVYRAFDKQKYKLAVKFKSFDTDYSVVIVTNSF